MDTQFAPPHPDPSASPAVPGGPVTRAAAEAWLGGICFRTGPPGRVGIELELLVASARGLSCPVPRRRLTRLAADLAGVVRHARVTQEPGGQIELSLFPAVGLEQALSNAGEDLAAARSVARGAGMRLLGAGVDPIRRPVRILDLPRYAAMEAFFDADGPLGRVMMSSTASLQVNLDPARTTPIATAADQDPREAFVRYALAAPVMLVRRPGARWSAPSGLTFGGWLDGDAAGTGLRPPTGQDLAYHLTTLFPPVRPRGFLEVRYLDAQPARWWRAAAATVWALAEDRRAGDQAAAAAEPVSGRWADAARYGNLAAVPADTSGCFYEQTLGSGDNRVPLIGTHVRAAAIRQARRQQQQRPLIRLLRAGRRVSDGTSARLRYFARQGI